MHKENICSVLREVANAASSNIVGFRMPKSQFMTSVGCSKYRPSLLTAAVPVPPSTLGSVHVGHLSSSSVDEVSPFMDDVHR